MSATHLSKEGAGAMMPPGKARCSMWYMAATLTTVAFAGEDPGQCDLDGIGHTLGVTTQGINFLVHYDEGECQLSHPTAAGDYVPTLRAQDVLNAAASSVEAFVSQGFLTPCATTLPAYHVLIRDGGNSANDSCIYLDGPSFRCATDDLSIRAYTLHEMFHTIELHYVCGASCACDYSIPGWAWEGTPKCMEDRLFIDVDLQPEATGFRKHARWVFLNPQVSLFTYDMRYAACLLWSYCCEQLGSINPVEPEPEMGSDFIRRFWEQIQSDGTNDADAAMDATIKAFDSARSLDDVFLDYTICNYTHDLDVSALPNSDRYYYKDERQSIDAGVAAFPAVDRTYETMPAAGAGSLVPTYAANYYEVDVSGIADCQGLGFHGTAPTGWQLGWALIGVTPDDRATILSKGKAGEFARTFIMSPTDRIDRMGAVVVGLGLIPVDLSPSWYFYEYEFAHGDLAISIIRPTITRVAYAGSASDPERFTIRLYVEGPEALKPDGVGQRSVKGLHPEDFTVTVGGIVAEVFTADYVGGEYWLVVQAPQQLADGLYDLAVSLCLSVTASTRSAVLYGDVTINHMVVMDISGSMDYPAGNTKLEAAKIAGKLYIDAVSNDDRFGIVAFNGDGVPCNGNTDVFLSGPGTVLRRSFGQAFVGQQSAGGLTSMGDGVWKAQDELDPYAADADLNTILLLSDGMENEARRLFDDEVCDNAMERIVEAGTVVNAIAFGREADQPRMQWVATDSLGDFSYVDAASGVRQGGLSMINALADTYMSVLQRARRMERLFFGAGTIEGGVKEYDIQVTERAAPGALFFFNVDDVGAGLQVELTDPDGNLVTPALADIFTTPTHVVFHLLNALVPGNWHVRMTVFRDADYIAGLLARQPRGAQLILRVAQVRSGGLNNEADDGQFEQGVPVALLGILTDSQGPIRGARINVAVDRPDGTQGCGLGIMRDDGTQNDGEPNDGVYGLIFTRTAAGSRGGVNNDDPLSHTEGWPGSYRVHVRAQGQSNSGTPFVRLDATAFHVFAATHDSDQDGLPDTWETYYGTKANESDSSMDPDADGLSNQAEFQLGSNPLNQDTDADGEQDGSEVAHGRCPLDPRDGSLPAMRDVEVIIRLTDYWNEPLNPNANLLRFPWHPEYAAIRVYRAANHPAGLAWYRTLGPAEAGSGTYYDENVTLRTPYYYRFQAVGSDGGVGTMSPIVRGVPGKILGDFDNDGDIDLTDYTPFMKCMSGPDQWPRLGSPEITQECLESFDFDHDSDIDLADFGGLQIVLAMP